MQPREKCLCVAAVLLVVLVSVSSAHPYDEQQEGEEQSSNVRDKRTLNFLLKSFADAIGYDVQKRPSIVPFGLQVAPVGVVTVIPPIGPVTPVKAPAMVAAPAAPPMAPAAPAMAPAAPAMAPAAPAMAPAAPAVMVPAPAVMAPAPAVMVPAKPVMGPAAPAMVPAPAGMAPPPAAMAPAAPVMPPAAPVMPPAAPAMPPAAPAMPPASAMAPAAAPGMPSASPAAPAMPPAAPAGKAAPLLTETIRKVFNLNFNWNRNLQPQINGVAPNASAAPAPQMPAAGAPASQIPAAGAPASQMPAAGAPAPQMPAPAPQMPTAPAAGQAVPAPAVPNIVPLAVPVAKDPVPAPMAPAPDMTPAAAPVPATPEMVPAAPKIAPAPPAASAPVPAAPGPVSPAPLYYQPIQNVQVQPNAYQELQNINQPQQVLYYPNEQAALNEANSNENLQKDYSLPEAVQLFWQHSPWNQPHLPHVQNAVPEYREYSTPDGERGYHVRRVQQNAHLQHHDLQPEDNDTEEEEENNARERQEERSSEENDDANGDSSKAFVTINNEPRGFQPAYAESRNQYQNGGFYQPGLPLAVHGVHEDKVLVAWPSPFELAGSEKKLKKVDPHGRISSAASENLEYRYQPDNYNQFNFYTIPPPTKNQYENYQTPSDPNIEDTLSANARIHENNYGKKYTTVHIDRQTYHH